MDIITCLLLSCCYDYMDPSPEPRKAPWDCSVIITITMFPFTEAARGASCMMSPIANQKAPGHFQQEDPLL